MNNFHLEGAGGKSTWIARQVSTKTVSPSRCFLYLTLEFSAKPAQKSYLTLGQVSTGTNGTITRLAQIKK